MNTNQELIRVKEVYKKRINSGIFARYSLFKPGELYMLQRKEETILHLLKQHNITVLNNKNILEIGCGRGLRLVDWVRWGAAAKNLYGIDVMPEFIKQAKENCPGANLSVESATDLSFEDEKFDIIMQSTVFTSILDNDIRQKIANEMLRVLKQNGVIIWYDFRYPNPKNPDVSPIGRKEIRKLFSKSKATIRSTTLAPPISRRLARISFTMCRIMEIFSPLRTHYLAIIKK